MSKRITAQDSDRQARTQQSGFTLVELSIVIIIIGLILGGVVQGQQLIDNARLQAVMREVEQFKSPSFTFQDRYQALPGDMLDSVAMELLGVPGGDGNGVIGNLYANAYAPVSGSSLGEKENRYFWNHLSASGVLNVTQSFPGSAADQASNMEFGRMFPRSRLTGAGFTSVRYTANAGEDTAATRYWARLHRSPTGNAIGAISPAQAAIMDRKFDDGDATSGAVRAVEDHLSSASSCLDDSMSSGYDETNDARDCIMLFDLF